MKQTRKEEVTECRPEIPYHIVCGIIFKNQDYAELRAILDAEMKRLK